MRGATPRAGCRLSFDAPLRGIWGAADGSPTTAVRRADGRARSPLCRDRSRRACVQALPVGAMLEARLPAAPVANAAFVPGADAGAAPAFAGTLRISQAAMRTQPALERR